MADYITKNPCIRFDGLINSSHDLPLQPSQCAFAAPLDRLEPLFQLLPARAVAEQLNFWQLAHNQN